LRQIDLAAEHQTALALTGKSPDVLAFDPDPQLLYVAAESGTVAVFRLETGQLHPVGTGRLAAGAHTVAVDPGTHRVFFPLPIRGKRPVLRVMRPSPAIVQLGMPSQPARHDALLGGPVVVGG
jgi:6-phosphogluconolactonase (cycloisomerase 2 family)